MTTSRSPGQLLTALRAAPPLVQCITNYVAMNIAANVVLAAGASPAMVHAEEEAGEFAAFSGALTINIGTLSPAWVSGMKQAAKAAARNGKPWVLDPVAHYATGFRRESVAALLDLNPAIIRGNASEIIALAGRESRALVAGGAGFIGSHLCDRLIAQGTSVVCLDSFITGRRENVRHLEGHPRFRLVEHDVIEPLPELPPFTHIYNLACAASPPHYQRDPEHTR